MGEILVGTASWTDRTLLRSGWYPPDVTTPEERLRYYAGRFPVVEVDATYYALPAEGTARLWAERTPPGFVFDVKAFSLLTGHPTRPRALPADLRASLGEGEGNLYVQDLDPALVERVWERFVSALLPLREAGRFGAVLFQFPRWFPIGGRAKRYILECGRRCGPLPISVEFRNRTWMTEENRAETLDFLRSYAIPYVCVDMPQGHPCSIPPVVAATADLEIVRFHGRSDKWTSHDIHERFGYLYSPEELEEWAPRLCELGREASTTHVLMNNCYRDHAQTNARQLAGILAAMRDCAVRPAPASG
ncbi:DUF72 domain-containing protein [Microbispora sp. ATCC PTA-5024]|uniref:DUF72 domain-containing protein n=1 Tax=Microbispora sp. ATCC PTA-5024 TaxID=316330 RepID=UPI0003DD6119|nr:DUF72 domain-containing protein [Microbispora sp. ATCC PTA-5024]ETK30566.1 hypothetical protein MPTA5024_39715 [Microbispora sp. ATCC PTA-5024]